MFLFVIYLLFTNAPFLIGKNVVIYIILVGKNVIHPLD